MFEVIICQTVKASTEYTRLICNNVYQFIGRSMRCKSLVEY